VLIAADTQTDFALFYGIIFLAFFALLATFFFGYWISRNTTCPCPYTGNPLRRGREINWHVMEKVLKFLFDKHQKENPIFDIHSAAWCRETGRIFAGGISFFGTINVDWSFLKKRYPGNWISWGSLTEAEKLGIFAHHETLKGFQVDESSPYRDPSEITKEYAFTIPGPLYVDPISKTIMGWQVVPETELEVLIVQKPKNL
jgi:hypothetical protein